jgi:hypothetical protein
MSARLPAIDFSNVYPHLIWVSSEARDRDQPDGFRYKLLSVRHEACQTVEFVIVRENHLGDRARVIHARGPVHSFEATTESVLAHLGQNAGVTFELYDLRDACDLERFRAKLSAFGWEENRLVC